MPDPIHITALRCAACGMLDPGPRDLCAACQSPALAPAEVPSEASLVSWTTIRRAPIRFKGQAPYTIAVVDLAAGLRLTGRIECEAERLRLDLPVQAVREEGGAYIFMEREA